MIKHLSKAFESLCDGLAIANLIILAGAGFFAGFFASASFHFDLPIGIALGAAGCLVGLIIGYIVDVIVFGYFAQIIEIRKLLENQK